jgi:hypothetical protein
LKKVDGGASDALLTIDGIKGKSHDCYLKLRCKVQNNPARSLTTPARVVRVSIRRSKHSLNLTLSYASAIETNGNEGAALKGFRRMDC